jgi:hypothetical protein
MMPRFDTILQMSHDFHCLNRSNGHDLAGVADPHKEAKGNR